jgi:hypothetical protein
MRDTGQLSAHTARDLWEGFPPISGVDPEPIPDTRLADWLWLLFAFAVIVAASSIAH